MTWTAPPPSLGPYAHWSKRDGAEPPFSGWRHVSPAASRLKCRCPGPLGRVWFSQPEKSPGVCILPQSGVSSPWPHWPLLLSVSDPRLCMGSGTPAPNGVISLFQTATCLLSLSQHSTRGRQAGMPSLTVQMGKLRLRMENNKVCPQSSSLREAPGFHLPPQLPKHYGDSGAPQVSSGRSVQAGQQP